MPITYLHSARNPSVSVGPMPVSACMLQSTFLPRPAVGSAGPARHGPLRLAGQQRSRGWRALWRWLRCRLTPGMLCKLLAGIVAVLVVMHATSCGFFFCYTIPGELWNIESEGLGKVLEVYIESRACPWVFWQSALLFASCTLTNPSLLHSLLRCTKSLGSGLIRNRGPH